MTDSDNFHMRSNLKKEMINAWSISEFDDDESVSVKTKPRKPLETVAETSFDSSEAVSTSVNPLPPIKKPVPRRRKQKEIVLSPRELESPSSKPSASDSGFALSPGRSSASSNRLEEKEFSEDDCPIEQRSKFSSYKSEISVSSSTYYSASSSEHSLFSLRKPIPLRRKFQQNTGPCSKLNSSSSYVSIAECELSHLPIRGLNRSRGKKKHKGYSEGDDDADVTTKRGDFPLHSAEEFGVSSSEYSLFSLKKPIPARRKHKELFTPPREVDSPISRVSTSDQVLVHSPGKLSINSSHRGDDKESGPSSLPARADTPGSVSSHQPSVGELSLDGSHSVTSQSDTRSYRERIRERVQAARGTAPATSVQSRQSRLKQRLLSKPVTSRFDVLLHKEEARIEEALLKREQTRSKWLETAKALSEVPKEQECYDFFTRVWESEVEETEPPVLSSTEEIAEEESGDQRKLLASEYLGLQDDWTIIEDAFPTYQDWKEMKEREEVLYFFPPNKMLPLELKLPPDQEPRYPETEGLYVGRQLPVRRGCRNRMEQRIFASGELKWFGDDGELIAIPDPRSVVSYKLPIFVDLSTSLETEYREPVLLDLGKQSFSLPIELNMKCLLVLEIGSVTFTHHPLFSREHVLAQRLKDIYEKHRQRASLKNEERLRGRLHALRRARAALQMGIENPENSNDEQKERLKKYSTEVREVRQKLYSECRRDRQLLAGVLNAWKDLKEIREQQGFINTTVQLKIQVQKPEDSLKEIESWNKLIEEEWEDLEKEKAEEYNMEYSEYRKRLNQWKKKRKQTLEKQKQRRREMEDSIETDEESVGDDESGLDADSFDEEPKPPSPIDWTNLKTMMIEQMRECFWPPGEPKLLLDLTQCSAVSVNPNDMREQQRRSALKRSYLYARILYNEQEVCQTKSQLLGPRFEVTFHEKVSMRIAQWPESIKVELYEEGGSFARQLIAEVFIPIPSHTTSIETVQNEWYEFSNTQVITYGHAGVGSGTYSSVYPAKNDIPCLYTTGLLLSSAAWGIDKSSGHILSPPEKYGCYSKNYQTDFLNVVKIQKGIVDLEELKKWAENSLLDPNDPNNSSFLYFLKNVTLNSTIEPTYFRLDPIQSEFDFCSVEDLLKNHRLRLLYLRDRGEPEFRGIRQVPLREKEISEDVFKTYEQRLSSSQIDIDPSSMDPLDVHRAWGKRFLQEIRQQVLKQCHQAHQHRKLEDIVTEDQVPDIGTLGLTFMQWFRPKRPLKPARKERKKVTVQGLGGQDVHLIVNVIRAYNVPVRKDVDTIQPIPASPVQQSQRFPTIPVRPFVEASFQGMSARTVTALGNNPTWNQDLQLPLRPPSGDFTPGTLHQMQDALHLHLFDEIIVDLLEDDRMRETNIHQRLERNWLGSLCIPFITLYHNARIEGTFKLYSPPVLLGYEREAPHRHFSGFINENSSVPHHDATFLTLFVNVQPALNPPEPFKEQLECGEPAYLQEHLQNWEQQVLAMFPHRRPKTLVVDTSGKSICVTRFIRHLAPPDLLEGETTNEYMAVRFVSMIPSVSGSVLFPGIFDVWLSSDQVLKLLSGDSEDHAVLFCCYLLRMKRQAWVLLGSGIPHGPTAYVLEQIDDNYRLWDIASGQHFDVQDSFCPLRKIYCLINDENIWANIQSDELPQHTRFDVNKRSDWWPAFGRVMSAPTTSIQPVALKYNATSESAVQYLQDKIEKHLRDSLMKWRCTSRTLWNRYCVAILRKLLPALERETWKLDSTSHVDHIHELQHILGSHKMCGFPINVPYTNISAIIESVKSTGVHYNQNPEVEFALAVYIHPYPNNVLSVWVYVASLLRRR